MRYSLISAAALTLLAVTSQAQATDYAIDPSHTYATFEISHFNTSTNRGRFDKKRAPSPLTVPPRQARSISRLTSLRSTPALQNSTSTC